MTAMTAMSASNGDPALAPSDPTTSLQVPAKRKRSESADELASNAITGGTKHSSGFSQRLQNALPLLQRADPTPSLLNHPLSLSGERSPKRPRYSSESLQTDSIGSRIESDFYHSSESLLADVDSAVNSLIQGLQSGENAIHNPDSISKAVNQINLFKQSLGKVCKHIAESDAKVKAEHGVSGDGFPGRMEEIPMPAVLTLAIPADKGSRPLYSGLQRQSQDRGSGKKSSDSNHPSELQALDPGSFPNGIALTQLPPSSVLDQAGSAKRKRNFSDVFRPHRSLKALEPPRPSRNATRGSSLGWVNHEDVAGSERSTPVYKSDYRYASLPTGSWLHYSGAEGSVASDSDSKRRQRDRALSFGESRPEPAEETVEHEQAKTRALFQAAYSSFAPSFDNSTAIVPEKIRSQAWWNKIGQKRFHALLTLQYPESDLDEPDSVLETTDRTQDGFEAAIAAFEQDPGQDWSQDDSTAVADPKDIDEVLQEVSDLIQTLSSYQRIRNLSKMNSGPATPTSAEADVYEVLRSNLCILINSLPPYAVAKLNGDQLEALNVSTNIVVEMKDHVGTMESDEYTASMQRPRVSSAATQPAIGRASVSSVPTGRPGNFSAQSVNHSQRSSYASTPRTPYLNQSRSMAAFGNSGTPQGLNYSAARPGPASSQRAGFPNQQHVPNQTYSHGPSTAAFQRPSSTLPNGYGSSYAQNMHSQAYGQPQSRQSGSSYSYPSNQSPQRPVQSPHPAASAQQQYVQPPQKSQVSPSVSYALNNQVTMTEQARAQLQAQRQLNVTAQTANINGQYGQMGRHSTPGGGTANGHAAVAVAASASTGGVGQ